MRLFLRVQYANSYPKGFCMESSMLLIPIVLDENQSIHLLIAETLKDTDYVEFTKKPKFSDMFSDLKTGGTRQIGFVYRVKSEIEDKKVFFDAWVTIYRIEQFPFDQLNRTGQIRKISDEKKKLIYCNCKNRTSYYRDKEDNDVCCDCELTIK